MAQTEASNGNPDKAPSATRGLRSLSVLLQRLGFATRSGRAYGGLRNYDHALGYEHDLTPTAYRQRYERGGVARSVVRLLPDATWAGGASLVEDDDPEVSTDFERDFAEMSDRVALWSRLRRADILAGMGRFGVLLIGAPGRLQDELPRLASPDDVLYLRPYSEESVSSMVFETDPESPRFGLPVAYSLAIGMPAFGAGGSDAVRTQTERVHWSRVIHIADGTLGDDIYGEPRLRPVWNYLDDLLKVVGGGAEAAWKRADPGMNLKFDKDTILDAAEVEGMEEEVEDYIHGLTRVVRTRGGEVELLQSQVAGFGPNAEAIMRLIAATIGVPVRILTGSERGELASSQDRQNFADRIAARRLSYGEPIVRALVDRLMGAGALPEVDEYHVEWPEIEELGEAEKAEVLERLAAANHKQAAATGEGIITAAEMRDRVLGLAPIDDAGSEGALDALRSAKLRRARRVGGLARAAVRRIHAVTDRHTPRIAGVLLAAWTAGAAALPATELTSRLESGNMPVINSMIGDAAQRTREALESSLSPSIRAVMVDAAESELSASRSRGRFASARISMEFNATNPRAVEYARAVAAGLVTEVTPEIVAALRQLVIEGLADGIPPRELARRIRQSVGLRTDQIQALANLRAELLSARPGTTVVRFPPQPMLRDLPGFRARIPDGGATEAWVERQLDRYRTMHLNLRARLIARTEAAGAANAGVRELWRQAIEAGELASDVKRVWITAGDDAVRDEHAVLEGEVVGIDESFSGGFEPGEEPHCRCIASIARPVDIERFEARS